MLIDLWLLIRIDLGPRFRAVNDIASLAFSTLYWFTVATILTALVTWVM